MPIDALLPWQKELWESLLQRKKQGQLPHALLFTGMKGLGKTTFAKQFAAVLLCSLPTGDGACGHCPACRLQQAGSHPDFMCITPEEGAQIIKIDQIRDIVNLANGTAMLGGARVVLVYPASAMNMHASNALLKTLEEPTANTFLILISEEGKRLPATIRSRCQVVVFPRPARDVALSWLHEHVLETSADVLSEALDLAEGAPFRARDFCANDIIALRRELYTGLIQLRIKQADPLSFAARFEEKDIRIVLQFVLSFMRDLLRLKLTGSTAGLIHLDDETAMKQLATKLTQETIFKQVDLTQQTSAHLLNGLNLNRALLLKDIFIRWATVC